MCTRLTDYSWRYDGSRGSVWVKICGIHAEIMMNNNGQEWPRLGPQQNLVWSYEGTMYTMEHDAHTPQGKARLARAYGQEAMNQLYHSNVNPATAHEIAQKIIRAM
jgi:hypothetical protein